MEIPEPQGCEGILYRLFMGGTLIIVAVAVTIALL